MNGPRIYTHKCLSIGIPKIIYFPFVPNGKLIIFRCPNIWPHYSLVIMCLNFGTLKNWNKWKSSDFSVPILKHFRVGFGLFDPVVSAETIFQYVDWLPDI